MTHTPNPGALAELERLSDLLECRYARAELLQVRADIAELLAACKERDEARTKSLAATKAKLHARRDGVPAPDTTDIFEAMMQAEHRYAAALARCQGGEK